MEQEMMVHKVTLSSNKVVFIKDMKIKDQELAAQSAGMQAGDNKLHSQVLIQKELIKQLVVKVDNKILQPSDKEDLDSLFNFKEYAQISQCIEEITGVGSDSGKPVMEVTKLGS